MDKRRLIEFNSKWEFELSPTQMQIGRGGTAYTKRKIEGTCYIEIESRKSEGNRDLLEAFVAIGLEETKAEPIAVRREID